MDKLKLDSRTLFEAIKIYYEIAWESLPENIVLRRNANYSVSESAFQGSCSLRLGRKGYGDLRFVVHYYPVRGENWEPGQEYSLRVETDDRGNVRRKVRKENQRIKELIEAAWRNKGFPVRPQ
jgi:hypothetical protein